MRIILIVLTFIFSANLYAQEFAVADIDPKNRARAVATVRQDDCQVTMLSQNNVTEIRKKAITIHNSSGDDYAAIYFFYDKSKQLKSLKGEILNRHGLPIAKFSHKDFSDRSATGQSNLFDEYRMKYYIPQVHEYPYTLVYSYEVRYNQNLSLPTWRPNYNQEVSIEKSSYTFQHQSQDAVRIFTQHLPKEGERKSLNKMESYTWQVENIPAEKIEPYSLPREQTAIRVDIVPERFQFFKKEGSFTNWKEFGSWVNKDLLAGKQELPESTKLKVKALVEHCNSDQEKAQVLYKYMQEKTRYISIQVGIGGLEPFSASTVDQLGYGDCKALVNYMQSLLQVVDIPSYYCIVEAGERKVDVNKDFANVSDGNHIILCLPFAQDTTWLECTSNKLPFGNLGSFTADRLLLACTPEGGKLMRTPEFKAQDNMLHRKGKLSLSKDGDISGTLVTKFTGLQFEDHFYNSFAGPSEQTKFLKSAYDIDNISFDKYAYQTVADTLVEELQIQVKSYAPKTDGYYILQPNLFNRVQVVPESKNRKNAVYINQGFTDIEEITIDLPEDASTMLLPSLKKLECAVGSYELTVNIKDNKLIFKRTLQIHSGTYSAETYADFQLFTKESASFDKLKYNVNRL